MSLVSTFVESQTHHWYENPVIYDDDWFICWDDDDPIELVLKASSHLSAQDVIADLAKRGWQLKLLHEDGRGGRIFDKQKGGGHFEEATWYFLEQVSLGPTDEMLKGSKRLDSRPHLEGTYYSSSPNGNGDFR